MIGCDLHTHTTFSDGKNTPEEMVRAAMALGFKRIGISDHSYTSFDGSCCMKREDIPAYRAEISRLKAKYAGQIEVLCGIEQDLYADLPPEGYDYAIGSVHYLKKDGEYLPVDESVNELYDSVRRGFGGDATAFAEAFFAAAASFAYDPLISIIGHFDLLTIFSDRYPLFDEDDPRYIRAWQSAAARLISAGKCFEINTGGMARKYRALPYPSDRIISFLIQNGARLVLSSDSHSAQTIGFGFEEVEKKYGLQEDDIFPFRQIN